MTFPQSEFQEIGHSGGQVTFTVVTQDNKRSYQVMWQTSRPVPAAIFGIYALQPGVPVGSIDFGGIGKPWNPAPFPGCVPVFIASDSQGKFGHQCPRCQGYWRSGGSASMCPYCALRAERHDFLTEAQRSYVAQYCEVLIDALSQEDDGDHVIDMDAVADAAGKDIEKPKLYYAEQTQQNQFTCDACGSFNDILGKYCYCSMCGTRNDLHELIEKTLPAIRDRANSNHAYEVALKEVASAFDSFVAQYVKQMIQNIPMRSRRRLKFESSRFHNLASVRSELNSAFDIDIGEGIKDSDLKLAIRMFHRRHVYEHNGGEVDEKYIVDSGDKSVRLKELIRENQKDSHQLMNVVTAMARNLHNGFHDIFPPNKEAIKRYAKQKENMRAHGEAK